MSKYDIKIRKLAFMLLPTFLRRCFLVAFLYTIVSPLENIYARFTNFRKDKLYQIKYNGQICYLRAVLNDIFDPTLRRITVTDNPGANNSLILLREVNYKDPVPVRKPDRVEKHIYHRGIAYDFWVNIPHTLLNETELEQLREVVNTYKLVSKRFNINTIEDENNIR